MRRALQKALRGAFGVQQRSLTLSADNIARLDALASCTTVGSGVLFKSQQLWRERMRLVDELKSLADISRGNPELSDMAEADLAAIRHKICEIESSVCDVLLSENQLRSEDREGVLEVRACTGGTEAGHFASELFEMYTRYAAMSNWSFKIQDTSTDDHGGIRYAAAMVCGNGVLHALRHECGVHRVQRVPSTEARGRVHTSTASVAALPVRNKLSVETRECDFRVEYTTSRGPGGQSVNKAHSAARVTHVPSGITVTVQEQRCAVMNRERALQLIHARLFDAKLAQADTERKSSRLQQTGHGDRSEKIRTYNFPQSRVTDHRLETTFHNLAGFMAGEHLAPIAARLDALDKQRRISEALRAA